VGSKPLLAVRKLVRKPVRRKEQRQVPGRGIRVLAVGKLVPAMG